MLEVVWDELFSVVHSVVCEYRARRLAGVVSGQTSIIIFLVAKCSGRSRRATRLSHSDSSSTSRVKPLHECEDSFVHMGTPRVDCACSVASADTIGCIPQALITGDMILGCGTAIFEDFTSYMASLKRVLEMSPKYGGGFTR